MTDIMKANLGEPSCRHEPAESARNGVRVRRASILPAKEQAVILISGTELGPLGSERFDMSGEDCELERVQNHRPLCILGFAVRLNNLSINDHSRRT
jgi:hypothetical protein